ncbi:hypothetical protein GF336_02515 [Candidatus Woesearchaeota archaeon]|nr:hypothetical protein [Candidatus Woesearchaeota archaeon]
MEITKIFLIFISFAVFLASSIVLFEPGNDPTGYFSYVSGLGVMNPENNLPVGEMLEIKFITKGEKDLEAKGIDGDFDILGLRCGEMKVQPMIEADEMHHNDYRCDSESVLTVKVLSDNVKIGLKFGKDIQYAKNSA